MKRFTLWLFCIMLALGTVAPSAIAGGKKGSKSTSTKTVHVKTYTKKSGTTVHTHMRSAPGTKKSK